MLQAAQPKLAPRAAGCSTLPTALARLFAEMQAEGVPFQALDRLGPDGSCRPLGAGAGNSCGWHRPLSHRMAADAEGRLRAQVLALTERWAGRAATRPGFGLSARPAVAGDHGFSDARGSRLAARGGRAARLRFRHACGCCGAQVVGLPPGQRTTRNFGFFNALLGFAWSSSLNAVRSVAGQSPALPRGRAVFYPGLA